MPTALGVSISQRICCPEGGIAILVVAIAVVAALARAEVVVEVRGRALLCRQLEPAGRSYNFSFGLERGYTAIKSLRVAYVVTRSFDGGVCLIIIGSTCSEAGKAR